MKKRTILIVLIIFNITLSYTQNTEKLDINTSTSEIKWVGEYAFYFGGHDGIINFKEGHFIKDKAEKWWIIYDIAGNKENRITRKYQYKNNKKNGYCLLYKNDKLFKAEKYSNDLKLGEWTDIFSFKKDNPNASL